jgi:site-specific DNA recombinase
VATYRRASTDEANQPFSLEVQDAKLNAYITSQDGMVRAADYEERASGKDIEGRPQLLRLLEDAAAGKFDVVLVYKVDRWSRRLADLLGTLDLLDRHGVSFVSATEPIDTSTNMGRMILQILGSFAEFERGLIVERVTRGIEAKLAKGLPLTPLVGYGLRCDATGKVEADPATFGVVQRIFREYTQDRRGTKAIATGLQADGLPAPGRTPWNPAAVARILRNRTFIGELPFRDGWVPGAHQPLLDRAVFDHAQLLADQRATPAAAAAAKADFLLTGTVVCGHCGGAYNGTSGTSKNKTKVRYYTCITARKYGKARCQAQSVPAAELETLVTDALLATYTDTAVFTDAINGHLAARAEQTTPLTAELSAATAAAAENERVLRRYRSDYEAGTLDAELYSARAGELNEALLAVRARIAELEAQLDADLPVVPTEEEVAQLHATLTERIRTGPVPVRKALFAALVDRLEVHAIDDVRPTFRLGGADLLPDTDACDAAGHDHNHATSQEVFACRAPGWS